MALLIPRSVGGTAEVAQTVVEPIETRVTKLVIPASVGGVDPVQPVVQEPAQPIQQAQPLSQIVPQAAQAVTQAVQKVEAPETGLGELFTGSARIAANPELGTLPEFLDTRKNPVRSAAVQLGILSTFDEQAQRDIIQEQIPEAELEIVNGSTIIRIPKGDGTFEESVLNRPGISQADAGIASAQLLAFMGPAKLAELGKSLAKKIGIGLGASATTEQALQEVGVELGRKERDPSSTAIAGLTGGASEVVSPAIQAFRQARQARSLGVERAAVQEVRPLIESGQEVTRQTGIELTPAQKTLDPFALEEQSFLGSLPAAARTAVRFLRRQNEQAQAAVKTFFEDLAPSEALQTGNVKARDAAKDVVQLAKDVRSQASKPFYKKAFSQAADQQLQVDVNPILEQLDDLLQVTRAPSKASSELQNTFEQIQNSAVVKSGKSNLESLHRSKMILADKISKKGDLGLDPTSKRDLTIIFDSLKNSMEATSPGYRDAQRIFAQASGPVDNILVSKIGQISKITDEKINTVSRQIFDESITDPEVIKQTRKAIESIDPEAWSSIVRVEAQRRLKNIDLNVESLTPENAPSKIVRALFGSGNKRSILLSSLTNGQMKNAIFLEEALKRASRGRPGGSQTGVRAVITDRLQGASLSIRRFLKNPIERLISTGEESAFNRNVSALGEAVFDPKWEPQLSKIRKFKSDSPAAARAMTQLLDEIGQEEE